MAVPGEPPAAPVGPLGPLDEPGTLVLVVAGRIARADIPAVCERIRALLESSDAVAVVCDVGGLTEPDAVAVDALARLQLTALRVGRRIWLRDACDELQALLALAGLADVVPSRSGLRVEPSGQPEQREKARGVEEETDPGDPTS